MIEDALKSTRTLHRLIMTVSLVTIVFALSINLPEDKAARKQLIDDLAAIDFTGYSIFLSSKVEKKRQEVLVPLSEELGQVLENKGHLIFGLDQIGDAFSEPIHVGRILLEDLLVTEMSNATIVGLNALNGLSLGANVQISVPQTDLLMTEIDAFLSENPQAGRRIDEIRVSLDEFDFTADSFLPGQQVIVGIYFELLDAVRTGGVLTFSASFLADIVEIEDTSFLTWLGAQDFDEGLVQVDGVEVVFAPGLQSAPTSFASEKLGVLSLRLENEIASSSPANQSVSILGTNVPGALTIFASPIILFALSYYFGAHTAHLSRIVSKGRESFEVFSWLPLSIQAEWRIRTSKQWTLALPFGALECLGSAVLLPIGALALLFYRLQTFGSLASLQIYCLLGATVGILLFGLFAVRHVLGVCAVLAQPEPRSTP
ncbi:hypothetical protein [Nereida sp. MMG025]|uniref:hypothetical protein n=1 Tax=Nereida sp. MMG025 TaxID=2909981 RepID=UPI001F33970F|nr:hypothetical protein [Nereida sp. MMG025]MCF6445701.1 hypothetical protein [Nereida sp. MMG025]